MELFFELTGKRTQQWALNKSEVKIGRDPACDVRLSGEEFPMVSRFHAAVRVEAGGCVIEDLNSPNGTLLNGSRVQRSKIFPGDALRLGSDGPELRIRFVPAAEKTPFVPPTIAVSNPEALLQSTTPKMAPQAAAAAITSTSSYNGEAAMLERRLENMRKLLSITLAAVVLLAILVTYQSYLIGRNQDTLLQLRRQATDAVGQFAPAMDQRMAELRQRADQMQDAVNGVDGRIKKAEDQFMRRIETEMPAAIDRYIERKLADIRKIQGK